MDDWSPLDIVFAILILAFAWQMFIGPFPWDKD
jgi:hypothetical protein